MRIAFITHTAYPDFIGGREHHIHNLATALSSTDDVIVIAGDKEKKERRRKINGYELITLPMISIRVSKNPLQIYRIVKRIMPLLIKEDPDLVHAFEYGSYTTDMSWLYAKKHEKPFFITVYGYQFNNPFLKIAKTIYDYWIGRKLFAAAARIFCPSQSQYEEVLGVVKDEGVASKIIFQENCIAVDEYSQVTVNNDLLKEYNLNNQVILLITTRLLPRKGLRYLLMALDRVIKQSGFGNIKLLIVGPNCGELNNIKNIIRRLGLENIVIIVGAVPYAKIKNFYGICDIFVLPSLYEGLPLALLEAMAAGKAVIFTDLPCASKIIIDGENGLLVEAANVGSLAAAIKKVYLDDKFREVLGYNARKSLQSFDSRGEAEKVKKIYQEITNRI
ncbi:MAG: glycosyltransferase family 4 protein [Candidatus Omnitrophota bacterium]